ncbi:hypothetical protein [Acetobacter senegalensis]|uniref:hypothetical protein n=1 Tax=Acetobacter senegalensis TaxID=446692 RepID=UPI002651FC80|nr:hypothetical protein [Acetobacter senegalensis]MDN7352260.1 hypothetical protein [Acetobacter senegalensis]
MNQTRPEKRKKLFFCLLALFCPPRSEAEQGVMALSPERKEGLLAPYDQLSSVSAEEQHASNRHSPSGEKPEEYFEVSFFFGESGLSPQ